MESFWIKLYFDCFESNDLSNTLILSMKLFKLARYIHIIIEIALGKPSKSFFHEKCNELAFFKLSHYSLKQICIHSVDIV